MCSGADRLPPIRVLGIGSPFGADDIGWRVIDRLAAADALHPFLGRELLLQALDRPGAGLLPYLEHARHVLLLDAVLDDGLNVAAARRYSVDEIQRAGLLQSSHGFGVQQALSLAGALGQLPDVLELWGICIGSALPENQNENIDWDSAISDLAASLERVIIRLCLGFRGKM